MQHRAMTLPRDLILIASLDDHWRPARIEPLPVGWSTMLRRLIEDDSSWVALIQRRAGSPVPKRADIMLTRAVIRSLRAIDARVADHLIIAPMGRFSFRAAGLL